MDYYLRTDIKYTKEDKENYKRLKEQQAEEKISRQQWQRGDWEYNWYGNGLLESVKKPDGSLVSFEYDALGRRISKTVGESIKRFLWDANVILHEWELEKKDKPRLYLNDLGELIKDDPEPISNLVTWVYEEKTFVPSAKIVANETFSIISDCIGRPVQCYNENGSLVWQVDYDIYGRLQRYFGVFQIKGRLQCQMLCNIYK